MESATVTSKGQFVIPARIRRSLGIRKGTRLAIEQDQGRIVLQPVTPDFIRSLRGSVKPKNGRDPMKILMQGRRQERTL